MWDWVTQHGNEIMQSASQCASVSHLLDEYRSDMVCSGAHDPERWVAHGLWYTIIALEQSGKRFADSLEKSEAMGRLKNWAQSKAFSHKHDQLERFCENPHCTEKAFNMMQTITPCYTSSACTAMTSFVSIPFDKCMDIYTKYMNSALDGLAVCDREVDIPSSPFCSEMQSRLLLGNSNCYMEILTPRMDMPDDPDIQSEVPQQECTAECVRLWQAMKARMPMCTDAMIKQRHQLFEAVITLISDIVPYLKKDEPDFQMPQMHFEMFDEYCDNQASHNVLHPWHREPPKSHETTFTI